jgi:cation diffusion facilitator family transporter
MAAGRGVPRSNSEETVGRWIALASITGNVVLATAKIWVGLSVGSAAVVSDGFEAAGDILSSAAVYTGLWLASKPPDYEHPYGHGRYETLAGLCVGAILLLIGAGIIWESVTSPTEHRGFPVLAVYPLIATVAIKTVLAVLKFRTSRRIRSTSLRADGLNDLIDLVSTFVAMAAVGLTMADPSRFARADQVGAIIIGSIIFFISIRVVWNTIDQLLDTMPEPGKMGEISEVALAIPGALGIEKCLARRTGLKYHVDLHLEVDPEMTVRESHQIATRVKNAIKDSLPWVADVLVHVEPTGMGAARAPGPMLRRRYGK